MTTDEIKLWDASAEALSKNPSSAVRYVTDVQKLPLKVTIKLWFRALLKFRWYWDTSGVVLRAVMPGDAEYNDAPYAIGLVRYPDPKDIPATAPMILKRPPSE